MNAQHTNWFSHVRLVRICLSKHSPLSGSEVGPMGAVRSESLAGQNRLHCTLCAGGDLGLQTDQSAGRWWGWKVWRSQADTQQAGMKTDREAGTKKQNKTVMVLFKATRQGITLYQTISSLELWSISSWPLWLMVWPSRLLAFCVVTYPWVHLRFTFFELTGS